MTCLGNEFVPNDLSETSICGYMAGFEAPHPGVNLDGLLSAHRLSEVPPEFSAPFAALGKSYAFFMEKSGAPLQDAYITRCRFVSAERLAELHPGLDADLETQQISTALRIARAFLRSTRAEPDYRKIYGDYCESRDFHRYGDEEQFSCGHAIWLEREGVIRCWSRVIYVPQ